MQAYNYGRHLTAKMSPRISGLITLCFVLFLSQPVANNLINSRTDNRSNNVPQPERYIGKSPHADDGFIAFEQFKSQFISPSKDNRVDLSAVKDNRNTETMLSRYDNTENEGVNQQHSYVNKNNSTMAMIHENVNAILKLYGLTRETTTSEDTNVYTQYTAAPTKPTDIINQHSTLQDNFQNNHEISFDDKEQLGSEEHFVTVTIPYQNVKRSRPTVLPKDFYSNTELFENEDDPDEDVIMIGHNSQIQSNSTNDIEISRTSFFPTEVKNRGEQFVPGRTIASKVDRNNLPAAVSNIFRTILQSEHDTNSTNFVTQLINDSTSLTSDKQRNLSFDFLRISTKAAKTTFHTTEYPETQAYSKISFSTSQKPLIKALDKTFNKLTTINSLNENTWNRTSKRQNTTQIVVFPRKSTRTMEKYTSSTTGPTPTLLNNSSVQTNSSCGDNIECILPNVNQLEISTSDEIMNVNMTELELPANFSTEIPPSRIPKMSDGAKPSLPQRLKNLFSKESLEFDYRNEMPQFVNTEYEVPEFHPGTLVHYLRPIRRRPVYDEPNPSASNRENIRQNGMIFRPGGNAALDVLVKPTRYNYNAIGSTFYPFRLDDVTMKFGNKITTAIPSTTDVHFTKIQRQDYEMDNEEVDYRDLNEGALTMETLAYFLIGTCCSLSILCLCIVVAAIKCRRTLVERKLKKQFRSRFFKPYYDHKMVSPWQQQFLDQVMFHHKNKQDSTCSSGDACNCRCMTWSLGARNLDMQPICPTRNGIYMCGRKKLPFGAASTLQYESMLEHRHLSSPQNTKQTIKSESSNENDSLDEESDTDQADRTSPKQCTCIRPTGWKMHETPQHMFGIKPFPRFPQMHACVSKPAESGMELRHISRDCPPPVSGLNYLDRAEGVVYWSSNEERLI